MRAFVQYITYRFGMIVIAIFDNGKENLEGLKESLEDAGTLVIFISPYNSKANGIIEAGYASITGILKKTTDRQKGKWVANLNRALLADRSAIRASHRFSAFYLLHSWEPILPLEVDVLT